MVLLIDLSTYYVEDGDGREYNVVEPPLGLMALISYINDTDLGKKTKITRNKGTIYKERTGSDLSRINPWFSWLKYKMKGPDKEESKKVKSLTLDW